MRVAVARALAELADRDSRILLLTADLGFMALDPFFEGHPDRFFNVGVSEQNMLGVAAGLAADGFIPFVYSIATFASLRPYEFFRNGAIRHNLPVRVVAVGGGFEYGTAGSSHHALEDIALMRAQPDLAVVAPADADQARAAILATWDRPGPIYFRIGKDDRTRIPGLEGRFDFGRIDRLQSGSDLALVTSGAIAAQAVQAAAMLASHGVSAELVLVPTLNPPPSDDLWEVLARHRLVVTLEAHYINGGLGSLVAEVIAERGLSCRLVRCGVARQVGGVTGGQSFMEAHHGLSAPAIVEQLLTRLPLSNAST